MPSSTPPTPGCWGAVAWTARFTGRGGPEIMEECRQIRARQGGAPRKAVVTKREN